MATEIFVQEAGPSLLWATAEVRRRASGASPSLLRVRSAVRGQDPTTRPRRPLGAIPLAP